VTTYCFSLRDNDSILALTIDGDSPEQARAAIVNAIRFEGPLISFEDCEEALCDELMRRPEGREVN